MVLHVYNGVQHEVCSVMLRRYNIRYVVLCYGVQSEVCITLVRRFIMR